MFTTLCSETHWSGMIKFPPIVGFGINIVKSSACPFRKWFGKAWLRALCSASPVCRAERAFVLKIRDWIICGCPRPSVHTTRLTQRSNAHRLLTASDLTESCRLNCKNRGTHRGTVAWAWAADDSVQATRWVASCQLKSWRKYPWLE